MTGKTNLSDAIQYISKVFFNLSLVSVGFCSFFRWIEPRSSNTTLAGRCALCFFAAKLGADYLADAVKMIENDDDTPDVPDAFSATNDGYMSPGH